MLEVVVPLGDEQVVKQHVDLLAEEGSLLREQIEQVLADLAYEINCFLEPKLLDEEFQQADVDFEDDGLEEEIVVAIVSLGDLVELDEIG